MPINQDASFVERMPRNVAVQFLDRVKQSPDREAYRFPKGDVWESRTWKQTGDEVSRIAAGLLALGIQLEQRVGIASATRYEWIVADLAVMCAGAATTTVYPSTNAEDTAYIVSDSECRIVFAEDDVQVEKLVANRDALPHLGKVVNFDGKTDGDWVIGLDDLAKLGDAYLAEHPSAVTDKAEAIEPDQLATLIYTSGTTGKPKGVRLRHRSWVYQGEVIKSQDILSEDDLQFLWLPMAHSFGKVLLCSQLGVGFPTAVDGRVDKIIENLAIVKPTFMGAAPRIFEKAHGRIVTMQAAEGGAKEKIFKQAFAVGLKVDKLKREGKSVPLPLKVQHGLFDKLVFSKIRDRFGGRVRFFISGAAALNSEVAEWFHAAGINILEGYGLTETSAGSFVNRPDNYKFGTVGLVLTGTEAKIAEDGEVMIKGPGIMDGLPQPPRPDGRGAHRGRLAAHRRHRRDRRRRLPQDHRPQEGPVQDLRRQVHRAVGDRVPVQGDLPLCQPVPGRRCRAQLLRRAAHARPRPDDRLGRPEQHGGRVVLRGRADPGRRRDGLEVRRRAQRSDSTGGRRSRST